MGEKEQFFVEIFYVTYVPVTIILDLIVAGEDELGAEADRQREQDLLASQRPDLGRYYR